jgi:hypothetical protein
MLSAAMAMEQSQEPTHQAHSDEALNDLALSMTARRRLASAGNKKPTPRELRNQMLEILDEREREANHGK